MGVPKGRTKRRRYKHIDGVDAKALRSRCKKFRFRLDIVHNAASASGKTVCVVMQNPSYAGQKYADKSVQFLEKFVFERRSHPALRGVRRLVIVNQFARIMTKGFRGTSKADIGKGNDRVVEAAIVEADIVILAWGESNKFKSRQAVIYQFLKKTQGKILCKTAGHPSRGRFKGFIQRCALPTDTAS